jgi:hypothetical protein
MLCEMNLNEQVHSKVEHKSSFIPSTQVARPVQEAINTRAGGNTVNTRAGGNTVNTRAGGN